MASGPYFVDVSLHAFARHVHPATFARRDLVDLIDEDDPAFAGTPQRFALHGIHVDQLRFFFLREHATRIGDRHALLRLFLRQQAREHLAHVTCAAGAVAAAHHAHRHIRRFFDFDLD